MQLPIGAEDNFVGIIDLVNNVAHMFTDDMGTFDEEPIPAEYANLFYYTQKISTGSVHFIYIS